MFKDLCLPLILILLWYSELELVLVLELRQFQLMIDVVFLPFVA